MEMFEETAVSERKSILSPLPSFFIFVRAASFPGHLSPSERQSKPTFQLACQLDDCGPSKGFRLLLDNINHDHVHWTSIF
ncbi:Trafficking protein particle complex subunit [Trichinella pseudospiralis]